MTELSQPSLGLRHESRPDALLPAVSMDPEIHQEWRFGQSLAELRLIRRLQPKVDVADRFSIAPGNQQHAFPLVGTCQSFGQNAEVAGILAGEVPDIARAGRFDRQPRHCAFPDGVEHQR
jgi:hypothetical protein